MLSADPQRWIAGVDRSEQRRTTAVHRARV